MNHITQATKEPSGITMTAATVNPKEVASEICNTIGVVDNYPLIYDTAWQIQYKGKATKKNITSISKLQSDDVRKLCFVPAELLDKLKSIIR